MHGSKFVNYICQKVLPTIIAEVVVEASTDDEAAQETSSDVSSLRHLLCYNYILQVTDKAQKLRR